MTRNRKKQPQETHNPVIADLNFLLTNYPTEVIEEANFLISNNKHNIGTYLNRGIAHLNLNNVQAAIDDFSETIRLDPNYETGYYNLGCVYLRQKEYEKARHHLSEAIIRNPQNFDAYRNRGLANRELGNIQQAIEDYSILIARKNPLDVYLKRAGLYCKIGEYEKAIEDMNQFVNKTPKLEKQQKLIGYHERAKIFMEMEKYELACNDFSSVLKLNPDDFDIRFERASLLGKMSKFEKAIEDYSTIINSNILPICGVHLYIGRAYLLRGMLHEELENREKAFNDYCQAIKLDNKDMYAYFNRGCISMNRKNVKEAIEDFTQVLSLDPLNHKAFYYRGVCYEEIDTSKALDDFKNALRICPTSVEYYFSVEQLKSVLDRKNQSENSKWILLGVVGLLAFLVKGYFYKNSISP